MPDPQTGQIDLSAGFVPKSGGGDIDISAGLVPRAPSTSPQPYTPFTRENLQAVSRFGGKVVHALGFPTSVEEFKKAAAAEAEKPLGQQLAEHVLPVAAGGVLPALSAQNAPAIGRTAAKTGHEVMETARASARGEFLPTLAHAAGTAGYAGATVAAPFLGEAPSKAGEAFGRGEGEEGAAQTTAALLPFAAGEAVEGLRGAPKTLAKAATAPEHIEALTGFVKTTKTDPHATASVALPEARAVAAREGVDPAEFQGRRGGEMVTGRGGVFHKAIQEHRAEYAALRRPVENLQLDTTPIAQAYLDKITPEMEANAPEVAERLHTQAEKFADIQPGTGRVIGVKPQPLSQLDDFRVRLNNELDKYEQSPVDKQIRSDVEVKADKAAADAARDLVYKNIARSTPDPAAAEAHIRDIQQRQGALIEARRDLTQAFNDASGQQGEAVAGSLRANPEKLLTLREKASHLYPSKRGLERSFVREVISPKPLELFNNRLRMMFEGLEKQGSQVQAPAAPPTTPPITLGPGAPGLAGTTRSISVNGQPAGSITYEINGDTLTVHNIGGPKANYDVMQNVLGPKGIATLTQQLRAEHPGVKFIQGIRVGGARGAEARSVRVPVERVTGKVQAPKPPPTNGATPAARALSGPERTAAIATVMSGLKRGDITEQEADQRIQRLNGGGGRKLIRFPVQPGGQ